MKKAIVLLLSVLLIVCPLTACSDASGAKEFYKTVWGLSPEQAAETFGVSFADAEVNGNEYIYTDAKFEEKDCTLKLFFESYNDTDYKLSYFICTFAGEEEAEAFMASLEKKDGYTVIGDTAGFYGADDISDEDAAWLDKQTLYHCGEEGVATATVKLVDGVATKNELYEDEMPVVTVRKYTDAPSVTVSGGALFALSVKDQIEALHPDGSPVME